MKDATPERKVPKVVVIGAGIGGLTLAHELSKTKAFDVTVYERNTIVGGLARSKYYVHNGRRYPVEYSWRVYGSHYKNLRRVLSEISHANGESVLDRLVEIFTYIFPRFDKREVVVKKGSNVRQLTSDFKPGDARKILKKVFLCMTMSTERMDSMDHIKWRDFCADLSPEAQKFMVRMWGPVLGMDPTLMSFPVIARMIQVIMGGFLSITGSLFLMPKPTNKAWFDVWVDQLRARGTAIKTEHEIIDIKVEQGRVTGVTVRSPQGETTEVPADYVVCALSVEALASIVESNPHLKNIPSLASVAPLAKHGRQIQLSVQFFLDKKLVYPVKDKLVLYLPDSPWALIVEPEAHIWGSTHSDDPEIKTVLSVGICQTDVSGILHKKPFTMCTEQEIKEEVWAQLIKSYRGSRIKTENGKTLEHASIKLFYMWDSYKHDPERGKTDTWEPKFSNNINVLAYQPTPTTELPNLLFATGYTKTQRFIYSMESAAEAGVLASNYIKRQHGQPATEVYGFKTTVFILKPLVWVDRLIYAAKWSHLSSYTGGPLVLVITYLALLAVLVGGTIWGLIALWI